LFGQADENTADAVNEILSQVGWFVGCGVRDVEAACDLT